MEKNIVKKIMIIIGITIVLSVLSGCADQRTMLVDKDWGRGYETAMFSQTENPDAGDLDAEVQDIDGQAANHNYNKYQKSFQKDETVKQTININVGN